jgi:preprotein translocase subunit SecE
VARNRKRAKERRARRPQPVATRRDSRDNAPEPIAHATPDVELAEAQLALGRPELEEEDERGVAEALVAEDEELEPELEPEPVGAGGGRDRVRIGAGFDGDEGGPGGVGGAAAPGAAAIPVPEIRVGLGNRLIGFLQGSWRELQRVQWPDRRQVAQATSVVIGFVIVAGVFLGLCDLAFSHLMNYILK